MDAEKAKASANSFEYFLKFFNNFYFTPRFIFLYMSTRAAELRKALKAALIEHFYSIEF